jgi:hypothetical protein
MFSMLLDKGTMSSLSFGTENHVVFHVVFKTNVVTLLYQQLDVSI